MSSPIFANMRDFFDTLEGKSPAPNVFRRIRTYVLNATVTSGKRAQFPLQIEQGSDFEWVKKIASVTGTGPGLGPFAGARIGIQDGATGRQLILSSPPPGSAFTPDTTEMSNYFGTAQLPAIHVQPYVFKRSTQVWVTIDATNCTGVNITAEIVFDGFDLVEENQETRGSAGKLVQAA